VTEDEERRSSYGSDSDARTSLPHTHKSKKRTTDDDGSNYDACTEMSVCALGDPPSR
jgi:hypothetical protein